MDCVCHGPQVWEVFAALALLFGVPGVLVPGLAFALCWAEDKLGLAEP